MLRAEGGVSVVNALRSEGIGGDIVFGAKDQFLCSVFGATAAPRGDNVRGCDSVVSEQFKKKSLGIRDRSGHDRSYQSSYGICLRSQSSCTSRTRSVA